MPKWREVKISDLGDVVGGATPSTSRDDYYNGEIPWITPKDLSDHKSRFINRGERNITLEGLRSCSTQILPKNTVLFSSRAPIGYVAIAANDLCTNQGFKSVIPNDKTDFMFLFYLLKYNKDAIENMASGTTFKEVSGATMRKIVVRVPDLETQKKIAKVLSALDDKIELNNKINKNLEEQAKSIYSKMFIESRPADYANGTLNEIADITMGQSPVGSSYNEEGLGEIFFQGRAEFGERFPTIRLYTTEPKRMAFANDTLISVRAPVGDLNVAHKYCCIGRGLAAIHSKTNHQSFLLYTMFSLKRQLEVFNGEGTVFGSINRDSLKNIAIYIPSIDKINDFENLVAPIDLEIRNNYDQICALQQIRDKLLPKLMSGEIDVDNVEI